MSSPAPATLSADLVGLDACSLARLAGSGVNGFGRDILPRRVLLGRLLVLGHALLEAFDALGNVAHNRGNLAAAAEHQERDGQKQQPMPNTQATHSLAPLAATLLTLGVCRTIAERVRVGKFAAALVYPPTPLKLRAFPRTSD